MIFIENCKYFRICFGPFRELWKISITKKTNVTIFVVVDMLVLRPASRRSSVCTCLDLVASQTQTTLTQCETDTELLLTTRMIRICRLPQTMSRLLSDYQPDSLYTLWDCHRPNTNTPLHETKSSNVMKTLNNKIMPRDKTVMCVLSWSYGTPTHLLQVKSSVQKKTGQCTKPGKRKTIIITMH